MNTKSLTKQIHMPSYKTDLNHELVEANDAFLKNIGAINQKEKNSTLEDMLGKANYDFMVKQNKKVIESKCELETMEYYSENNKTGHFRVLKIPTTNQQQGIDGILTIYLSQEQRTSKQLEEIEKKQTSATPGSTLFELEKIIEISNKIHAEAPHPNDSFTFILRYLESILNLMPGFFYCIGKDGTVHSCNDAEANLFNKKSRHDIIGLKISDILPHNTYPAILDNNKRVMDSLESESVIEKGMGKVFLSHKSPLLDHNHEAVGIIGISLDISKQYELEEKLKSETLRAQKASEAKTNFLMNISHDIRTPCSGIAGLTDILIEQEKDEKKLEYLKDIKKSIQQLLTLLNQIINLSRFENGEMPHEYIDFNIQEILNEMQHLYTPESKQKNIKFETKVPESLNIQLNGDRQRIQQILLNLIGNSIKFTDKGSVEVHVAHKKIKKDTQEITIKIRDTGPGIAADKIDYIFEAFTRIIPSYSTKHRGSGLGLSLVKKLVNEINGTIAVESTLGRGSCFTLKILLKTTAKENIEDKAQKDKFHCGLNLKDTKKRARILLIEDDPIAQKVTRLLLRRYKCQVDTASSGAEALAKCQQGYDLIISDIGLPDTDGFALTKKICAQLETVPPIIGLTAHADPTCQNRAIKCGMSWVTTKPITIEMIEAL